MPRSVTISPAAARAFAEARLWLCQPDSGKAGRARWDALREARRKLANTPFIGAKSSEIPGHRDYVISKYRMIYLIEPDTGTVATAGDIRIVALFGPGQ